MKLIKITKEEAKQQEQYFVYQPVTKCWHVYYGDNKQGIAYNKFAYQDLEYYKVERDDKTI